MVTREMGCHVVPGWLRSMAACHARLISHAGQERRAHDLVVAAHAVQTDRTILTFDAKARFADLPGVSATEP